MSAGRSTRKKVIRGLVLSGSIISFVPAFMLVTAQAQGDETSTSAPAGISAAPAASPTPAVSANQAAPSSRQTSPGIVSPSSSQTVPQTTASRVRARTRAS